MVKDRLAKNGQSASNESKFDYVEALTVALNELSDIIEGSKSISDETVYQKYNIVSLCDALTGRPDSFPPFFEENGVASELFQLMGSESSGYGLVNLAEALEDGELVTAKSLLDHISDTSLSKSGGIQTADYSKHPNLGKLGEALQRFQGIADAPTNLIQRIKATEQSKPGPGNHGM